MKQVFFCKGSSSGGTIRREDWEPFWEHDSTKLARFPLPPNRQQTLPWARELDRLGHARAADTVTASLDQPEWNSVATLKALLTARRTRDLDRLQQMVGHQEELDWLVYRLYGLVDATVPVLTPGKTPAVTPGLRPFEIDLAITDNATRAALARGETPDDIPTDWFKRHGWVPQTKLPSNADATWSALVERRRALTKASAHLRLLEAPVHKRRWHKPDYDKQEKAALRTFLLTRLEETLSTRDTPTTPRVLARALQSDKRFVAAAVVYSDTAAPDLDVLCAALMSKDSVAAHPLHRYSAKGMVKRKQWERTWALQVEEDRGMKVTIKKPPKYSTKDFSHSIAYKLRGPLDVPKERFVAHTEIPTVTGERRGGSTALYSWAGWTRIERMDRLTGLLEDLDDEGVQKNRLTALYDLMFRYVEDIARTEPAKATNLAADLRFEAGTQPTDAQLTKWLAAYPAKGTWT
jgi:hypothetical protein